MIAPKDALSHLLNLGQIAPDWIGSTSISGCDPILPTDFLLGTAGASVIAAAGVAASDLWQLRTGKRQRIAVDMRSAVAALRSDHYCRVNGSQLPDYRSAIHGFYPTRDSRWIQIHCNQPHHRDGVANFFGTGIDRTAIEKTIKKSWNAIDLENALTEAQLCAGTVRTREEWINHPHARIIDTLPLLDIVRIGDSQAEPLKSGDRPLSGIRVLDLTHVIAGPVGGRTMAEHGAEVLRLNAPHRPIHKHQMIDFGHGKRSAHLDLDTPKGVQQLKDLVSNADIFLQGYRPNALASRGLSPENLADLRPGIICINLCAYGHAGPWSHKRGFDSLVQSVSGMVDDETIRKNSAKPIHLPAQALDYCTGYLIGFAAMAALAKRAREGGSYLIRISLCQTGHWIYNLGRIEQDIDNSCVSIPKFEELSDLLIEEHGPFGTVRHLAPIAKLSETPGRWSRPSAPYGTDAPKWMT